MQSNKVLIFRMGGSLFALKVNTLVEVLLRPDSVTPIPGSPEFILGAFNLRGEIIAAVDIAPILEVSQERETYFLRVKCENMDFAFPVDDVIDFYEIEQDLQPPVKEADFIVGTFDWKGQPVNLLDCEKLAYRLLEA